MASLHTRTAAVSAWMLTAGPSAPWVYAPDLVRYCQMLDCSSDVAARKTSQQQKLFHGKARTSKLSAYRYRG